MTEDPTGVRQVREWRRKVTEEWEGKSWEEINASLQQCLLEYERAHRRSDQPPQDPAA
jgi:hypothetical protein